MPRGKDPAVAGAARRAIAGRLVGIACLAVAALLPPGRGAPEAAELVLRGGAVYTMDASRTWAEAVAIDGGRIVYVGPSAGLGAHLTESTRIVELQGRMVLPGFHDAHVHPIGGGVEALQCDLNDLSTQARILEAVRACSHGQARSPWLVGGGWSLPAFSDANPRREWLDAIVPDRPAYLSAADGHSAWVNSKALEVAGIGKDTPDPDGGRIERDPGTGEPTGTLREKAMTLVQRLVPMPSASLRLDGLRRALALAARFGITSLHEASASLADLETYTQLDRRGELTARVTASMKIEPGAGERQVGDLIRRRDAWTRGRVRVSGAKIFADGVIESRTASLLEPYLGHGDERGAPALPPDELRQLVSRLDRAGFQVQIHAIGDRAVREALDAFQAARADNGARDARHHIAHLQLIHPDDIPRFRTLDVAANVQPLWAWADEYITQLTEPVLGPERSRRLYPIGSLLAGGAMVVAGSDWSVSSMNPLEAIQVAMTRCEPAPEPCPGWNAHERAGLEPMLAAYTIRGAWLAFAERATGSIEVGKLADLAILDGNLFETPVEAIHRIKVVLTLLEGREVFRDPSFPATR